MPRLHQRFAATLPGFTGEKTYSTWPVWSGSTRAEVKFQAMPKKAATRLWHRARDFDRQTRREGCHGGTVGHSALQVLHALVFDFLNFKSGRLDPSYAAIARAANVCERTVATAIKRLRDLGILTWLRRCKESRRDDGQYVLKQETNAYAVLPPSGWLGYREPPEAPPPAPGTWGAPARVLGMIEQADEARWRGDSMRDKIGILATDPGDRLALALARLGGTMVEKGICV